MSRKPQISIHGVAIYEKGQHPRDLRKAAKPANVTLPEVEAEAKPAKAPKAPNAPKAPKADKPAKENKKSK